MSTILFVDDSAAFRVPVATVLRGEGHKVLCASNGVEALAAVREEVPDLILLDVLMPQMGGLEFLRHLRNLPAARHVPVILLSAAEGEKDVLKAVQYGVHGYLLKTHFSLQQLLARVKADLAAPPRRTPKAA
jgi:CheY-like chemotaxis protein